MLICTLQLRTPATLILRGTYLLRCCHCASAHYRSAGWFLFAVASNATIALVGVYLDYSHRHAFLAAAHAHAAVEATVVSYSGIADCTATAVAESQHGEGSACSGSNSGNRHSSGFNNDDTRAILGKCTSSGMAAIAAAAARLSSAAELECGEAGKPILSDALLAELREWILPSPFDDDDEEEEEHQIMQASTSFILGH